jgi:hypothetical protein
MLLTVHLLLMLLLIANEAVRILLLLGFVQ